MYKRNSGKIRAISYLLVLLGSVLLTLSPTTARAAAPDVVVLTVEGPIVPVVANYVDRGIGQAEARGVPCIIQLSTEGGLLTTTDEIVDRIMEAKTPVVVYIKRWAASAGAFITLAAHVAAIAPGARLGASTPVALGEQLPEEMQAKVTEDAAARIRGIAKARGRDDVRAEAAVREAASYDYQQALTPDPETGLRLVEIGADSLEDLLQKLDGMSVTLHSGREVTLHTKDALKSPVGMTWIERFLHILSNPNIAYILLSIGMLGIMVEFFNPGSIFPGVVGGICLLLAFYSMGVLRANWAGLALIILAFVMFAVDVFITSHGMLTAGGITSMIIGSLVLFSGSNFVIDWWLIALVVAIVAGFFIFAIGAIVRSQRRPEITGREGMVGKVAVARTRLNPRGTVHVHGELWSAILDQGSAEPGEELIVTKVEGLRLRVSKR
ncbi:MAG TPA: nodulation protein NfeD [Dehalococcoidia bacterium]|nr:nodulation protein NfeD [Dehalococcoidia bacterium]